MPERAPDIERRVAFRPTQAIGLPLILILPVLALFKVFDTTPARIVGEADGLRLELKYLERLRYRSFDPMEVTLVNETGGTLAKVKVTVDRNYVDRFFQPQFLPDVAEQDENGYVVEIDDFKSGDRRTVSLYLEADEVGRKDGRVIAEAEEGPRVEASFSTFVFP